MYVLIILFISVVLIIGIFCVAIICRDIVLEEHDRRKDKSEQQSEATPDAAAEQPATQSVLGNDESVEKIVAKKAVESEIKKSAEPEEENRGKVAIFAGAETRKDKIAVSSSTETLEEEFFVLSSALKNYYDEVVCRADVVGGEKLRENSDFKEFEKNKNRLVSLEVKRGGISSELSITIFNSEITSATK